MNKIDWDTHREGVEHFINLVSAFRQAIEGQMIRFPEAGESYLDDVMELQPIRSRQAAAVAIAHAYLISIEA
jgi:hypothetical protein